MPFTILLADDHSVVRHGLKALIAHEGFTVVGEASDGHEAVNLAERLRPNLALLDIAMPLLNGVDAAREITKVSPSTKVIILTIYEGDTYVLRALQAGVKGYVLKSSPAEDVVKAIREVASGKIYLAPEVSQTVVNAYLTKSELPPNPLTPREIEVLQLICEGRRAKEIAVTLGITVKAAESHRTRIMEKLNINHTAGLIRYAVSQGLTHI